jgi:hypothetical protein
MLPPRIATATSGATHLVRRPVRQFATVTLGRFTGSISRDRGHSQSPWREQVGRQRRSCVQGHKHQSVGGGVPRAPASGRVRVWHTCSSSESRISACAPAWPAHKNRRKTRVCLELEQGVPSWSSLGVPRAERDGGACAYNHSQRGREPVV